MTSAAALRSDQGSGGEGELRRCPVRGSYYAHVPGYDQSGGEPEIRPDVVEALLSALIDMDPARLAPLAGAAVTTAERKQAEDLFLASMLASAGHRERQTEAWDILITRKWPSPPTWDQLFDDLTPEREARLAELYDALPDGARTEYDKRYGRPAGT
jgi:hypothetical protein